MALTAEQKLLCEKWVSAPNRKWQTLNRSQWKYQFREKTLVRYVEEAKMDEDIVPLLLEYLCSDDCKSALQLYGQGISSVWAPRRAWYEVSNKSVGSVRAVRLYHALSLEPSNGTDGPYVLEDGCAYKVSWTYYWKRESVPAAPASKSGVSYRVTNVQPDPETGLFNYSIEKRERVRQDIEEYLVGASLYEETHEEMHLGVRGSMSSGGKKASVSKGTRVTRKVTKNADCTHDVHNVKTKAKAVSAAAVEYVRTLHGVTKTVTDRNQPSAVTDSGMAVGERRSTRRTDEDLNDNTLTTRKPIPAGKVESNQRKTIFAESSSTRENVAAANGLPSRTAASAGSGKTHSVSVQRYDDGTADVVTTTTQEKSVSNAVKEVRRTLRGKSTSVTHRGQTSPLSEDGLEVGESRVSRKTDGGRYDNTTSTFKAETGTLGSSCTASAAMHEDVVTKSVSAANANLGVHMSAEPNVIVERSVRMNDDGTTADVMERTRTLKMQRGGGKSLQGGSERTVETQRTENSPGAVPIPSANVNEKVEVSNTPNGAGGFNTVVTTTKFNEFDSDEQTLWKDDENECKTRIYRNKRQIVKPEDNIPGRKNVSLHRNDHGSWDGGYTIVAPRVVSGGIRIIERGKDITFASGLRFGSWKWVSGNMSGEYTQVFEYRRFCTYRVRYTGLTSAGADAIKNQLDSTFRRNVYVSSWNGSVLGGRFDIVNAGSMRMAKVEKFHIAGNVWGVLLDLNETSTRLSINRSDSQTIFGYESGWSYNIPSGGENVG